MDLAGYKEELERELEAILSYWMDRTPDHERGGFYGRIDGNELVHPDAPRGIVLNSRILWAFSAAYRMTGKEPYLETAKRACDYILSHFIDEVYGGVFWSVDDTGAMLNDRKQIYGLSFCIYGLSEYYRITKDRPVLDQAISLFRLIEKYSFDPHRLGYYEAFSRDWMPLADLRLSEKDANEKKTMNTHLHVVEAYANLYLVWPDHLLRQQIDNLLRVFDEHILDKRSGHLLLFFDEDWVPRSEIISYGHDIEAAWLLLEAANSAGNDHWMAEMREMSVKTALAAAKGLDSDGGLWYERESRTGPLTEEKHSWPQAEAMVGFMNAFGISGNKRFLELSFSCWEFVKKHIRDRGNGEWFWGVRKDHSPMKEQDKAGFWKCPYHNTRACLEVMHRIDSLLQGLRR